MRLLLRYRLIGLILALVLVGSGCGQLSGSAASDAPATAVPALTPAMASNIASSLWAGREAALSALVVRRLGPIETGAAQAADTAYIRAAHCGCEPRKSIHPLQRVIPMVPRGSKGEFIAQVRTTNSKNEHPWYLIGVILHRGQWRIGLVTFGGYQKVAPLHLLTSAVGYTPHIASADTRRMLSLVVADVRTSNKHVKPPSVTDYGATLSTRGGVRANDGVYGLRLPSGKEFVCFTMHQIDTYAEAGGLDQNIARSQWGGLLAPGVYSVIHVDRADSLCVVGRGTTRTEAGRLWLHYEAQVVGTTGTRLAG